MIATEAVETWKKALLRRLRFRGFRSPQELTTGEEFRLLFQNPLQERDRVAVVLQFHCRDRFEPMTPLRLSQLLLGFDRHTRPV